jgi:hypothetical protein
MKQISLILMVVAVLFTACSKEEDNVAILKQDSIPYPKFTFDCTNDVGGVHIFDEGVTIEYTLGGNIKEKKIDIYFNKSNNSFIVKNNTYTVDSLKLNTRLDNAAWYDGYRNGKSIFVIRLWRNFPDPQLKKFIEFVGIYE